MILEHNEGAVGVGTEVVANGVRGVAAGVASTAEASALVPAGVDEVSVQAAIAFATESIETLGINTLAQEELSRAGAAYVEASGIYETVDGANGATLI